MFFNAALRYIESVNIEYFLQDCAKFFEERNNTYITNITEFNETKWANIELSYSKARYSKNYFAPTEEYYLLVNKILEFLGNNYYLVSSQIAWVYPGQKIDKHFDKQTIYTRTRRIHIQISQDADAYLSVWIGDIEHKVNIPTGTIYELNNRIYHSVTHCGITNVYCILVLDFATKEQKFTLEDNVAKDETLSDSSNLEVWISQ